MHKHAQIHDRTHSRHVRTYILMFHPSLRAAPSPRCRQWRYFRRCAVLRSDLRSYIGVGCFAAGPQSKNEEKALEAEE